MIIDSLPFPNTSTSNVTKSTYSRKQLSKLALRRRKKKKKNTGRERSEIVRPRFVVSFRGESTENAEIRRSFRRPFRIVAPVAEFEPYSNPRYRVKWTLSPLPSHPFPSSKDFHTDRQQALVKEKRFNPLWACVYVWDRLDCLAAVKWWTRGMFERQTGWIVDWRIIIPRKETGGELAISIFENIVAEIKKKGSINGDTIDRVRKLNLEEVIENLKPVTSLSWKKN